MQHTQWEEHLYIWAAAPQLSLLWYTDTMKLLVLSLCCVAVLATTTGDFDRKQELEKVLDELSNALATAEEAKTDDVTETGLSLFLLNGTNVLHWDAFSLETSGSFTPQ